MRQVTISNEHISITVLDYGAIIQKVLVKDKTGNQRNVVVGLDQPNDYLNDNLYLGACIGRYAGRISKGGFDLNNKNYKLHHKDGVHLHGGEEGFSKKYWSIDKIEKGNEPSVSLSYTSKHLEEGYPGNLKTTVTYKLVRNSLEILHNSVSDQTTVVNLTNHSYFKLDDETSINNYRLKIASESIVELTNNKLPTGSLMPIKNSDLDFFNEKELNELRLDTIFALEETFKTVAEVSSERSGISLKVATNQPAIVVYTPLEFPAICFETQNFPDAPNNKNFPNSILKPNELYTNRSVFTFDLLP